MKMIAGMILAVALMGIGFWARGLTIAPDGLERLPGALPVEIAKVDMTGAGPGFSGMMRHLTKGQ